MHLKNSILFFCATFYFFQCQGAPPTSEQIALIKNRVPVLLGEEIVTIDKVRTVFSEVARELGINFEHSTLEEVEKIEYSKEDVVIFILSSIASSDNILVDDVNRSIRRHVLLSEHGAADKYLIRDVITQILLRANVEVGPFPSTILDYYENELEKTASNRSFTINEVRAYALAFLASGYGIVMHTVNTVLTENGDPDTMDYEKYRNVLEGVNARMPDIFVFDFKIPVPSYDLFKADILSRKLTVNGIENMIIEKLFLQ